MDTIEKSYEVEVRKRNRILIILLWNVVLLDILINVSLKNIEMTKHVLLFALLPLIVLTLIRMKVPSILFQYILAITIIGSLLIINLLMTDYISLIFLIVIPLFSLFYRDWKFILVNCIGSGVLLLFLILSRGPEYFVNWEPIDSLYWLLLLSIFYVIIILETKRVEATRKRLRIELNETRTLQKHLTYNELRYRSMLKQSSEGIYAFDPTTKKIVEVNQQFCNLMGYTEKEILTKTLYDIINDETAVLEQKIQSYLHHYNQLVGNRKYVRKDGTIIDVEVRTTNIVTDNENVILVNIRDITEKLKQEFELQLAKNILDYTLDGAVATDLQGKIIYVNPSFEKITGYSMHEAIGKTLRIIKSDEHSKDFYDQLWNDLYSTGVWEGEIINKKKNGQLYIQRSQIHAILDEHNKPSFYTSVFRDITLQKETERKLKEANEELNRLSNYDGLLGIPNRRYYNETLEARWQQAVEDSAPISLILFDIDHFKIYNDTYGHLQGDECLKQVARTLQSCLEKKDYFLARYGGEEFSMILPNATSEEAVAVAETLRLEIERLQIENKGSKVKPTLTISLGVATMIPTTENCSTELINYADQALYEAKALGRNKVGTITMTPH